MGRNCYGSVTCSTELSRDLFAGNDTLDNTLQDNTSNIEVANIINSLNKSLETSIEVINTNQLNNELFTPNDSFDNHNYFLDISLDDTTKNNEAENTFKSIIKESNSNKPGNNEISGIKVANVLIRQLCSEIDFLRDELHIYVKIM